MHILNRIPQDSSFEATVHPQSTTNLTIPIASYGDGNQRFYATIDGPLARVANGDSSTIVSDTSSYELTVEPNGLLSENMLVYGTVTIATDDGMSWTVDVVLEATSTNDEWWSSWTQPGRVIGLMLSVLGLSALSGILKKEKTTNPNDVEAIELPKKEEQDPWGRPLDVEGSSNPFDVQE